MNKRGMRNEILELKNTGLTYRAIADRVGVSYETVSYHLNPNRRKWFKDYMAGRNKKKLSLLKAEHGGKCVVCGYDRCASALDFHHINPANKLGIVSRLGPKKAESEAMKCVLICSNCHREIHAGLIKLALPVGIAPT